MQTFPRTDCGEKVGERSASDPLEGHLRPPDGLWERLCYYSRRYGGFHAVMSFIGRKIPAFWKFVGPTVTRPYLRRWLSRDGRKILNLGGGIVLFDQWLTGDVVARSDVYMDITRPLPLPDNSVDVVFSEEVIEHVSLENGQAMLRECARVLKPNGTLRLTTPSLDYFAARAVQSKEMVHEINAIFYGHEHRHIFSRAELRDCLEQAGFCDIRESCYRDSIAEYGFLDSHPVRHRHPPAWSQYWEAKKPAAH